ncbi:DUF4861 family protein [Asticcacaulis sp. EMRT-3]|uniref:DUF4861 family protein n=1 Tax=Asticcacaulis sp. EMRT-3 TaxID=3040349 RepID=UPI0024AEC25A|nr:DUF4861 family protein [Asticcacaulis sp. EMRT-3]MDI7773921.1 DUF4861 family protein [Asticcacaulis sp. EMRT-3]
MMKPALFACAAMFLPLAAHAQTVTVSNPLPAAQDDAVVNVPLKGAHGDWSVRVGNQILPAQAISDGDGQGEVRFVMPLAARQSIRVSLQPKAAPPAPPRVMATLKVQVGGTLQGDAIKGGHFEDRTRFTSPPDHFIHDGLIAFEGIGWESDRAGYRLYLDQRNVTDLFGKFGPDPVFPYIGRGFDDYQYPRGWGGDIYKVGDALGVGGVGLLRKGRATQTGPSVITGRILANGPVTAKVEVDADKLGGGTGRLHATYAITAGRTLTEVRAVKQDVAEPLVTGLTVHPGDDTILSGADDGWAYIGVWGAQEHGPDKIGTAVFYRRDAVTGAAVNDGQTLYLQFIAPQAHYYFGGRWVQENKDIAGYTGAVHDEGDFRAWLEATRQQLDHPVVAQVP